MWTRTLSTTTSASESAIGRIIPLERPDAGRRLRAWPAESGLLAGSGLGGGAGRARDWPRLGGRRARRCARRIEGGPHQAAALDPVEDGVGATGVPVVTNMPFRAVNHGVRGRDHVLPDERAVRLLEGDDAPVLDVVGVERCPGPGSGCRRSGACRRGRSVAGGCRPRVAVDRRADRRSSSWPLAELPLGDLALVDEVDLAVDVHVVDRGDVLGDAQVVGPAGLRDSCCRPRPAGTSGSGCARHDDVEVVLAQLRVDDEGARWHGRRRPS